MGKSKVAPEKNLSITRLELCDALLLARTISYLRANLSSLLISSVTAWSDYAVVLTWIKMPTIRLKTFMANRVAQIQHMTSSEIWKHLPTSQNPIDCATRGLTPNELLNYPIWWTGPIFLTHPVKNWPEPTNLTNTELQEYRFKEKLISLISSQPEEEFKLLYAYVELPMVLLQHIG